MVKERMPPLACLAELPSAAEIAARDGCPTVGPVAKEVHAHDLPLAHALLEAALKEPKGRVARSILKRAS